MTDIVDRLNARQAFGLNGQRWMMLTAPDADCVEAATEITRLRAALADAEAKLIEREKMCGDCCGYSEADRELLYGVHLESKRKLEEAEAKLVKARDDALEEAAKAAEGYATCECKSIHGKCTINDGPLAVAAAIRAMKT